MNFMKRIALRLYDYFCGISQTQIAGNNAVQVQTSNIIMNDEKVFVLTMTEMTHLLETVTDTSKSAEEMKAEARKIFATARHKGGRIFYYEEGSL